MSKNYPLLLLHFFRDLSSSERIQILVSLGALPPGGGGNRSENETVQRNAFDRCVRDGGGKRLWTRIQDLKRARA